MAAEKGGNGMQTELLRPRDLSQSLGVSTNRVYQLIAAGEIPSCRVGGAIRIPRQAWEDWLLAQSERAKAGAAR